MKAAWRTQSQWDYFAGKWVSATETAWEHGVLNWETMDEKRRNELKPHMDRTDVASVRFFPAWYERDIAKCFFIRYGGEWYVSSMKWLVSPKT